MGSGEAGISEKLFRTMNDHREKKKKNAHKGLSSALCPEHSCKGVDAK